MTLYNMLRSSLLSRAVGRSLVQRQGAVQCLSTTTSNNNNNGVAPRDMPYLHHGKRPRHPSPKFKSPRKRASKLFGEINQQACDEAKTANPNVLDVDFRVGDAIEIETVESGGIHGSNIDKIRGVVLGRINRGLGSSVILRDVVFGEPVERKIPLYSPLLKSLKVLEKNFVYKGKRKVKRAKLYFLRDRLPQETRVTKW